MVFQPSLDAPLDIPYYESFGDECAVFEAACAQVGQPLTLRRQPGYDHGYYFIQTFMADHLAHHAQVL